MVLPCTPSLETFLDNWGSTTGVQIADLYTFTLVTGEVFRYSGFQTSIVAPLPNTSSPTYEFILGPIFNRTKVKKQVGPQIDELEVDIFVDETDLLGFTAGGTLSWQKAAYLGLFDGAYCELDRCFLSTPPSTVVGTVTWFYGRVADIVIGRTKVVVHVRSLLDLLTIQMPRRLFQSSCGWIFGAPGCDYDRVNGLSADLVATGIGVVDITCGGNSDQTVIFTSFAPSISTSYDNGSIIGTSGLNNGFTRTIGRLAAGQINFLKPWAFPVVAGTDTFRLLPGCDHTLDTCVSTFKNQAADGSTGRFGGMPFVPPPETAI